MISFLREGIDNVDYQNITLDLQTSLGPHIDEESVKEDYYNKVEHPKISKVYSMRHKP